MSASSTERRYALAAERYAEYGVDTDRALELLRDVPLSLHCWQGDDVRGFETSASGLEASGLQVTGSQPGRARNAAELRADMEKALSLIPGRHRVNLHAMYAEFGGKPADRDRIELSHFSGWMSWAEEKGLKIDFNPTCFAHPRADSGFTLSHKDKAVRGFWIEHVRRSREIAAAMGSSQNSPCLHNLWIPDGSKDVPVDRMTRRALLRESLDEIFRETHGPGEMKDFLESKLFGIGSESFVVGSHDFYLGYAMSRGKMICLDLGHFHPTESVADKLSSVLLFSPEILLHISRGVRWDSDHVVLADDEVRAVAEEAVRSGRLEKIHFGLDYFDASMNRVGAWVLGARSVLKTILAALLEPQDRLRDLDGNDRALERLSILEDLKMLPLGAVWDHHCLTHGVPPAGTWLEDVRNYEKQVLDRRA
jgi:L-rhamnose isomerase